MKPTSQPAIQPTQSQRPDEMIVFVGAYTRQGNDGISVYRLDSATGALKPDSSVKAENASYLALAPDQRHLYAVNETMTYGDQPGGSVSAFAVDRATARLTPLNQQPSLGGAPCYISVEQTGRYALIANYVQGNVAMLPIQADGRLSPASDMVQHHGSSVDPERQSKPYAHSIVVDPANRYAIVSDLGIDKLMVYEMDLQRGKLLPHGEVKTQPGGGPRHLTFHPTGKYAYLIQEMGNSITAFAYDAANGSFAALQTAPTLPADYRGSNTGADVHVSPSGKFVYGSNRGDDSIVIHAIDEQTGKLTYVGRASTRGKTPRGFAIDPTGAWLLVANQNTNTIVTLRIDPASGALSETGHVIETPTPVCVKIVRFE